MTAKWPTVVDAMVDARKFALLRFCKYARASKFGERRFQFVFRRKIDGKTLLTTTQASCPYCVAQAVTDLFRAISQMKFGVPNIYC